MGINRPRHKFKLVGLLLIGYLLIEYPLIKGAAENSQNEIFEGIEGLESIDFDLLKGGFFRHLAIDDINLFSVDGGFAKVKKFLKFEELLVNNEDELFHPTAEKQLYGESDERYSLINEQKNKKRKRSNEKKFFKCKEKGCSKAFIFRSFLTRHLRSHTGERPFQCTMSGCGKRFTLRGNLTRHQRTHTKKRDFKCEECGKGFSYKNVLKRHEIVHVQKKKEDGE